MDRLAEGDLVRALRTHWGIEIASIAPRRSVVIFDTGPRRLVARLLPIETAALMATLLNSIRELGRCVPRLIPDHNGKSLQPMAGGLCLTVTTYVSGRPPKEASEWLVDQAGAILGRIHAASGPFAPMGLRTGRDLAAAGWEQAVADWDCNSRTTSSLRAWALAAHEQLQADYRALPTVLGHGDIHLGNLAVDRDVGLYDFGGCFAGARVLDVANGLMNLAGASGLLEPRLARAFLDGYTRTMSLDPRELTVLPTVAALDLVRIIAWIETVGHLRLGADDARRQREHRIRLATGLLAQLDAVGVADAAESPFGRLIEACR